MRLLAYPASLSSSAFEQVVERAQTGLADDVPKLFDLAQEIARIGDALERRWRLGLKRGPLWHRQHPTQGNRLRLAEKL